LDEPAKRQIKYLIQPSPDGSHRPKPAFGGPRATPSGGFYPHAPNAIKILKKKHSQSLSSLTSGGLDPDKEVEIIHQNRFHRLGDPTPSTASPSGCNDVADWEKIYDLPPHSSTITPRDTPRNVDVRGKLAAFESVSMQASPAIQQRTTTSDTHRPSTAMHTVDHGLRSPHDPDMYAGDSFPELRSSDVV
uniref:Erbb2 interacting protein n=1 Tax=Gongylonema pulchrum TaxID=637853 RepID=A0A183D6M4_9BILA